jgi:hypothetical protein
MCGDCNGPAYKLRDGTDVSNLPEQEKLQVISDSYNLIKDL